MHHYILISQCDKCGAEHRQLINKIDRARPSVWRRLLPTGWLCTEDRKVFCDSCPAGALPK